MNSRPMGVARFSLLEFGTIRKSASSHLYRSSDAERHKGVTRRHAYLKKASSNPDP